MASVFDGNSGWIKLYRQLLNKAIWNCSTSEQKVVLVTVLLLANHADNQWDWNGKRFMCKPGQFITSLKSLAKASGCSIQNVRSSLKKFERYEFLTNESTKTGRLITVINWEKYQSRSEELTNPLTESQQRANKDLTLNKNDNNVKNERNRYTQDFESWYLEYPRPQAKQDSFRNFEKVRKEKGLDYILKCTRNYVNYFNSLPEKDRGYPYSSNNFFGTKAYYLDFEKEKVSPNVSKYELDDYKG